MLLLSRLRLAGPRLRELSLAGLCLAGSLSASFVGAAYAQTSNATTVAGSLEGEFAVDDSGAATYSLPISVPPGIAGNEPRLALSYSSQAGNGPLGVGWGLSGLSAITRCGQRLVPHGKIHGVDFSAADRFCLDGQRLVAVSGDYGADGMEYRTEIESYAKVISNGIAGTGPASFTIWSKGGLVLEYGVTDDSRIEAIKADGTARPEARIWALNKQSDRSGNAITYGYTEDQSNGSYRINRIDYGDNVTAGTTATSSVRFVYEDRTDIRTWYHAGAKITQDKRLKNIQTFEAETLVADYGVEYDNNTQEDARIVELSMCTVGGDCLKPITNDWQATQEGWSEKYNLWSYGAGQGYTDSNVYPLLTGDWNGDGLTDIARVTSQGISFHHSTGTGWSESYLLEKYAAGSYYLDNNRYPLVTGDWNGDGRTDIARVFGSGISFNHSTGTGWSESYNLWSYGAGSYYLDNNRYPLLIGDWSGDGHSDIARVFGSGISFNLSKNLNHLIVSLTNSRGHQASIGYTPLTDKLVYTKGSNAVYPEQDYVSPLSVVQSVERDDGIGGKRKIEYSYSGAKVDVKRGSFLGFKQITSRDVQRETETITDYRQDWPFVRRTEKSVRQLVDGTPISEQENVWKEVPQAGGPVDVRLKSQVSKQYEINGSGQGVQ
ncbi:SpvB/TcaC N-terminal domain-containing protein [Kiloniella majae]|uniref:SpvB/TcaC N-terminal domain-containing protein n=1 Tax=Kiloniella majae TaxID=1938558 RepID=UPI000A2787A2|nr:SpvB/TcaC N-terminal domain-containing protein [Kiloniella majae]